MPTARPAASQPSKLSLANLPCHSFFRPVCCVTGNILEVTVSGGIAKSDRRFRCLAAAAAAAAIVSPGALLSAQSGAMQARTPAQAEIAASPAVRRIVELIKVVNSGDAAAMKAYALANGLEPTKPPPGPPGALPLVAGVLDLHRRSQGLRLVRVDMVEEGGAVATIRNKLTGDEQALAIKVEPQAPHRITALPNMAFAGAAVFERPAPAAPTEQARLQQIGSYLKRLGDADIFSGVVVIARDGKPVFSQAYGYADREKKIANTVATPFLLGSMNKLFTSLAIGQLVEQGKLSYEDPLSKFVPDFPDAESPKRIKIKHLLSHTSGLGGFGNQTELRLVDRAVTVQGVLDVAGREPPEFEPGTRGRYSNIGYQLLGRVIEVVTGEDYYEYMRKNVFAPAGMTSASFPDYDRNDVTKAQPYEIEFDGSRLQYVNKSGQDLRRGSPAGGGIASALDLIKLDSALRAGRIVKPDTLQLHASPKPELASQRYGYGFFANARVAKRPLVGHGGNAPGQCTEFGALTDTPYTIVVLSNVTIDTCMWVTGKILQALPPTRARANAWQVSSRRP